MKEKEEFGEWITKRSMIKEDGTLDYKVLKRNLNLFIFPASIPLFVFLYCIIPYYFSNIERTLALLLIAAVTAFGTYCSLILSAMLLNSLNKLTSKLLGQLSMVFIMLFVVLLFAILFLGLTKDTLQLLEQIM